MIINVIPQQNLWHRDGYEKKISPLWSSKMPSEEEFLL